MGELARAWPFITQTRATQQVRGAWNRASGLGGRARTPKAGAGLGSGLADHDYLRAGAEMVAGPKAVFSRAEKPWVPATTPGDRVGAESWVAIWLALLIQIKPLLEVLPFTFPGCARLLNRCPLPLHGIGVVTALCAGCCQRVQVTRLFPVG
jgi:hypothetical protein